MAPSNSFTPATTILSSEVNAALVDIADEITNSLAIDGQSVMTGAAKIANGSVSAPGLAFGSDLNTGLYRIGADNMGAAAGGVKAFEWNATSLLAALALGIGGTISPSQITASQNNYAPTGNATASVFRLDLDAAWSLTGIDNGFANRLLVLHNISAFALTLEDADTGSDAENRFALGADLVIQAGKSVALTYDATSSRWRALDLLSAAALTAALTASVLGSAVNALSEDTFPNHANDFLLNYNAGGATGRKLHPQRLAPPGYLYGLGLSNAADADHDITVAAGAAMNSSNAVFLRLESAITKRIDATWASGTGNGGLSSSLTAPANATWYHVHLIRVGSDIDVGFDTSITAANLIADHSATFFRRIGSVLTDGSANIIAFYQSGDWFWWASAVQDFAGNFTTSAASLATTVPSGVAVIGVYRCNHAATSGSAVLLSSLSGADQAPAADGPFTSTGASSESARDFGGVAHVLTNTSRQIRHRGSATLGGNLWTYGWIDRRGRDG